jgi:general secretion pathway protein I
MELKKRQKYSAVTTGCRGFTLLEVLVALVLLSISLVAVLELFSANLRGIAKANDYSNAVILAESKMREILDNDELTEETRTEATEDGYRIDTLVKSAAADRTENLQIRLLEIDLTVSWARDSKIQAFHLKTLKTVKKKV